MSATVAVLEVHQYKADDRGCSCENNWYDTRQTPEQDLHEHAIHVEKELLDAGIGEIAEARAQALDDVATAIDGEADDSFYATRRKELSGPYSKPMDPEHSGQLDGIELTANFVRSRATAERKPV
jgi:hypothetical protein